MFLQKHDQDPQFLLQLGPEAMRSVRVHRISSGLPLQIRLFPLNTTKISQIQVPTHRKSTNWRPPRVPAPTLPGNKTFFPPEAGTHHTAVCTHSNSLWEAEITSPAGPADSPDQHQTLSALTAPASLHTNTLL